MLQSNIINDCTMSALVLCFFCLSNFCLSFNSSNSFLFSSSLPPFSSSFSFRSLFVSLSPPQWLYISPPLSSWSSFPSLFSLSHPSLSLSSSLLYVSIFLPSLCIFLSPPLSYSFPSNLSHFCPRHKQPQSRKLLPKRKQVLFYFISLNPEIFFPRENFKIISNLTLNPA